MWRARERDRVAEGKARDYEQSAPNDERAARGLFYTPDDVADVIATGALALWLSERTGESYEEVLATLSNPSRAGLALLRGRTVLDPSCGAGALLAAVTRALPRAPLKLIGGDIDPRALALCRERLGERAELRLEDAREGSGPAGDIVLTNPPYGKDASSDDIDRYVTFWRAARGRVRPGGVLAVLAPPSWRTGVRYAVARRDVMGPAGVRRVIDLPRGSFPDAYVDTCVALCVPGPHIDATPLPEKARGAGGEGSHVSWTTLGALFASRRGILAPRARGAGTRLLLGPVTPFVWPTRASAFSRVRKSDVVEGKGALMLDRGPRLLVRRIVGRAERLTCVVTSERALAKKDFYVLAPRDPSLCLPAYAALLHARPISEWLARAEQSSTKEDFAQVTLTRLRELRVPRLGPPTPGSASAWLAAWAREGEALGVALSNEGTRHVDGDPRWAPLRTRLDAFVARLV